MHTQRRAVLIDETVERTLLEAAVAARSIYNSQPWQFIVCPRRIELYADPARRLRVADGCGRSMLISCGAALFKLRAAAEHLGFHPRVRLLTIDDPSWSPPSRSTIGTRDPGCSGSFIRRSGAGARTATRSGTERHRRGRCPIRRTAAAYRPGGSP